MSVSSCWSVRLSSVQYGVEKCHELRRARVGQQFAARTLLPDSALVHEDQRVWRHGARSPSRG